MDSSSQLQHPRRNLGTRHRSQADRFVKLAIKDPARAEQNLAWAEQNAQQAVLFDFTDERNWRTLAKIKHILCDGEGLSLVLENIFIVLGRDANQLRQLKEIDHLEMGIELMEAAFLTDPLDPEKWFSKLDKQSLDSFAIRCKTLDFSDQRANIIYGRRLERIRTAGHEELFIELVKYLLAHRPANHELWMDLGRLHERRNEIDMAWMCYDHVQQLLPNQTVRDQFLSRLKGTMDGQKTEPWSGPSLESRTDFLNRMTHLSQSNTEIPIVQVMEESEPQIDPDLLRLQNLLTAGETAEAFFLARSLVTNGEQWAYEWMIKAQNAL